MGHVTMGMVGLGTVGSGVVRLLSKKPDLVLKKIIVRDINKTREVKPTCPISVDVAEIITDPEIEIFIEAMGGEHPALEYIKEAITHGKHVVTANKEVLAKHGPFLFKMARDKGIAILFEAAVAGGVPLISTIHRGLEATKILSVIGILNGTTNFILSQMENSNESYSSALTKAQKLGLAEADPSSDVNGDDVTYKLSIISALAFGQFAKPDTIYKEGIAAITIKDIMQAKEFGYRIKLIGITRYGDAGRLDVRVHPMLIPIAHPLATVSYSQNGILISTEAIEEIFIVGPGAGQLPTASAVTGDLVNLSTALQLPDFTNYFSLQSATSWATVMSSDDFICPFYLRISVLDVPGVIGRIGTILGTYGISINSILQKEANNGQAEIVIFTQAVQNGSMSKALNELIKCDFLKNIDGCIRIFKPVMKNV